MARKKNEVPAEKEHSLTPVLVIAAVVIVGAFVALFGFKSSETAPVTVDTPAITVPDTNSSWKSNDSLKAPCEQIKKETVEDITRRKLLGCEN